MPDEAPIAVLSCSLNPASRSHRLALETEASLGRVGAATDLIDLRDWDLPVCNGDDSSYDAPGVRDLTARLSRAAGFIVAAPVYNYDLNAAAKNAVELTGRAWRDKPVGFVCAAGGRSSYMSPMGLANSLMLDFRCLIVPRFVYAVKSDFTADGITEDVRGRIDQLAAMIKRLAEIA